MAPMVSYGIAVAAVAAMTGLRVILDPLLGDYFPFAPFLAAVAVAAWFGGLGPSLVALLLGLVSADFLFLPPRGSLAAQELAHQVGAALYALAGLAIAWLGHAFRGELEQAIRSRGKAAAELEAGQELFQSFLERSEDAIVRRSLDGTIESWNAAAERLYGYAAAEVLGKPISILTPAEPPGEPPAITARIRRSEGIEPYETVRQRKDGSLVDVSVSVSPIMDASGKVTGAIVVSRDISGRKRAEQALRESEERFRQLADNTQDVFWIADLADRRVIYVSPAYEGVWGRKGEDLLADSTERIRAIHPEDRARVEQALFEKALAGTYDEEYRIVRPDGSVRWIRERGFPVRDDSGRVRRVAGTAEDVTERKRAEAVLRENEEQLRLALEAGRMGTWDWNILTGEVVWSPGLEAIHGLEPGSFPGTFGAYVQDILPEDRDRVIESISRAVSEGVDHHVEYRLLWPDGSIRWVEGRGKTFRDGSGRPVRMMGICTDITDRKRSEDSFRFLADASASLAALVDYESTLQKVADLAVPFFADWCLVSVLEGDGQLRRFGAARTGGQRELVQRLAGRYLMDWDSPVPLVQVYKQGQAQLAADIAGGPEALALATDREELRAIRDLVPRSAITAPLAIRGRTLGAIQFVTTEPGRTYRATDLVLAEDFAHRAAIAIENAWLYREVRDAGRRKDEFLATLAHELRNPLAPIRNALHFLRMNGNGGEETARAGAVMERQVQHMVRLIDDLLDVSRFMRGKIQLRKEAVDVATLVARAVETASPLIDAQGHELVISLPSQPLWLEADVVRGAQIISNLLNNAAKYTERTGRIWLAAEREGDEVVLKVQDTGIGIAPETLPHIFDSFMQADHSAERSQGGLGIGLSLVRRLVEMHGGSVRAYSEGLGKGSVFVVRFPALDPAGGPVRAARVEPARESAEPVPRRRVLVVDDNVDAAESLAMLIEMWNHTVQTAHDGRMALELARDYRPDVVLLDIGLPGMSGYQVAKELRGAPPCEKLLLVAMTGYGQQEDFQRSFEAGFDRHLVKPVDPDELWKVLAIEVQ